MSEPSKAVFLSYASQDAEAARRICEALRSGGVEVWFDADGGLEHGDEWDAKIRRQIKECVLFVAVISANTQAREEGYFRIEWDLAAERARGIASGVAFILPVVIDGTHEPEALVPDRFRAVQWTRLPGGGVPPEVQQRFLKLWSHRTGVLKHVAEEREPDRSSSAAQGPDPVRRGPAHGLRPTLLALGILIAGLAVYFVLKPRRPEGIATAAVHAPGGGAPEKPPSLAPSVSPARALVGRALVLIEEPNPSRETLEDAGQLIEQAKALTPTDAEAWAAGAETDAWMVFYNFDTSESRRERARDASARALSFDPHSYEARLARALVLIAVVAQPAVDREAEGILRALLQERPDDQRALELLGNLLRDTGRSGEAAQVFEQAKSDNAAGWAYFLAGQFDQADRAADRALREDRSVPNLELKSMIERVGREDLAAAQTALDQLPASALLEDHPASTAVRLRLLRREPEKALEILRALPRDWLSSGEFAGPKAYFTGEAHEMAGQHEAARADWRAALQPVEARLAAQPNDPDLLLWKAELLARLGESAEASRLFDLEAQLAGPDGDNANRRIQRIAIAVSLGRRTVAQAWLEEGCRGPASAVFHSMLRFAPLCDPLRGDPRFEQLLRDYLPKGAKPLPELKAGTGEHPPAQPAS